MYPSVKYEDALHMFRVLLKHVWNLLDLCHSEEKILKVQKIATSLKNLNYNIIALKNQVLNAIGSSNKWSMHGRYYYVEHAHTFEKLLLQFQIATHTNPNERAYLNKVKKRKVLDFCFHVRLSVQEVDEYSKLNKSSNDYHVLQMYKKLFKWRKQMFRLFSSNKTHWIKRYFKIVKDYKEEAIGISTLLRSSKKVMSERPHLAFIEEMSS
jgi:uncharacterized protein YpbB